MRSQNAKQLSKGNKSKPLIKRRVYIFDIANTINISKELAEQYSIVDSNLEKLCEQNISVALVHKRYDIVKVNERIFLLFLFCVFFFYLLNLISNLISSYYLV
jgi:hypothetical protein